MVPKRLMASLLTLAQTLLTEDCASRATIRRHKSANSAVLNIHTAGADNAIRAHSLRCPFCAGYRKRAAAAGRLLFFNAISSGRLFTELLGMGKILLFCPVYSPFPRTVVYWCPGRPNGSKPPETAPAGGKWPPYERGGKRRRL